MRRLVFVHIFTSWNMHKFERRHRNEPIYSRFAQLNFCPLSSLPFVFFSLFPGLHSWSTSCLSFRLLCRFNCVHCPQVRWSPVCSAKQEWSFFFINQLHVSFLPFLCLFDSVGYLQVRWSPVLSETGMVIFLSVLFLCYSELFVNNYDHYFIMIFLIIYY